MAGGVLMQPEIIDNSINAIRNLTTTFQAIGGIAIVYLVFSILNFLTNRKRTKEVQKIHKILEEISKKLGKK